MSQDNDIIGNAIRNASVTLKKAFGDSVEMIGKESFRYLDEKQLIDIYRTEIDQKSISKFMIDISLSVGSMRSSYLPIDLINEYNDSATSINESIEDTVSSMESNENAFMRMLGMPLSDIFSIAPGNTILSLGPDGASKFINYEELIKNILDERNLSRNDRSIKINNNIYSLQNNILGNSGTLEGLDPTSVSIENLENDIFKFSYLLLPPVQDHRISSCINEADKMIAPNFSNKSSRRINNVQIKSSLLENIIRIRMDRLSGRNNYSTVEVGSEDSNVTGNDYGILESLFVLRIRSALGALASKLNDDIDDFFEGMQEAEKIPKFDDLADDLDVGDAIATPFEDLAVDGKNAKAIQSNKLNEEIEALEGQKTIQQKIIQSDKLNKEIETLERQKIIEDSIMALLDDNTGALELQEGFSRIGSIKDSHLIGGILGVINLPKNRIDSELKKKRQAQMEVADLGMDPKRGDIQTILGVSKGVGAIDILVFVLALFTIPEVYLLGLLNDIEFRNFLDEYAGSGNLDGVTKVEMIESVNMLSEYIISGYKLLQKDIINSER